MSRLHRVAAAMLLGVLSLTAQARADAIGDFYRGKTINVIVGNGAGGGFDLYARLVAKYLGRHIDGAPAFVVQNMPGAGGRIAADYIANVAARDGIYIGFLPSEIVVDQLLDPEKNRFDVTKFNWLGRLNDIAQVAVVWYAAPALTVEQAKEKQVVLAASSPLNLSATLPLAFNRMVGTKFKVVPGFTTDMVLAMERGETDGVGGTSWEPLRVTHADLLRDNKIRMLYQMSATRNRDLPDVPAIVEFGKTDEDRQVFRLLGSVSDIGRALVGGPGIPAERVQTLRAAITSLVEDPDFVAEAEKFGLGLNYLPGEKLEAIVDGLAAAPQSVIDKAKAVTEPQKD
ncbi:MAG TPA: tripartite tricarboxylate transporter substrate-binding protein [Beijerinckiaceae bacterium]|nr:tripartite tricarboxylate transporter substrate-binding protein [Beijerinckiaceae bacterium]